MAEFQEVMKTWIRAREANGLDNDPLVSLPACMMTEYDIEQLELEVMSWGAAHPEPVYPTFAEYIQQFGVGINKDGHLYADFFKANEPMSADIAQKLGLEPKGV